jgi:uncharacterized OB-fold protein
LDEIPVGGPCKLITYSAVESLPWGIDERMRTLGVAEFPNGIKSMGWVQAAGAEIGMELQATWEPVRVIGGEEVEGWVFRPLS